MADGLAKRDFDQWLNAVVMMSSAAIVTVRDFTVNQGYSPLPHHCVLQLVSAGPTDIGHVVKLDEKCAPRKF